MAKSDKIDRAEQAVMRACSAYLIPMPAGIIIQTALSEVEEHSEHDVRGALWYLADRGILSFDKYWHVHLTNRDACVIL